MKKRKQILPKLPLRDGIISVSFVLNGKRTTRAHALSSFEVRHMKELCKEHGEYAANQVVWRGAIKMAEMLARNTLAEAGKECAANLFQPSKSTKEDQDESTSQTRDPGDASAENPAGCDA